MSVEENKALIRRYVEEVYNQQDIDAARTFIDESMPDSGIDHLQQFFNAFPDSHTTLLDLFGEGEKVVAYLFMTATNKGGLPASRQPARRSSFTRSASTAS